jgi:hypothetical protein
MTDSPPTLFQSTADLGVLSPPADAAPSAT